MLYNDRQIQILIFLTFVFFYFEFYVLGAIFHGCCFGVYEGEDELTQDPDDELDEDDFFEEIEYKEHFFVFDIRYDLAIRKSFNNYISYFHNENAIDNPFKNENCICRQTSEGILFYKKKKAHKIL
jgi:hypothetical protein